LKTPLRTWTGLSASNRREKRGLASAVVLPGSPCKNTTKAIADYTEAIQRDPGGLIAHQSRAEAWYHKQEFDKVIADCTVALRLDPHDTEVLDLRARDWCLKQEFDKVIADSTAAIRVDPRSATAFGLRAWAWS
jgi:tetratricopeptide (TPR) repeat protein